MDNTTPNTLTRTCTACNRAFPATIEFFSLNANAPDGLKSQCRRCRKLKWKHYYTNNKTAVLAKNKKHAQKHPEQILKAVRKWKQRNPDKVKQHNRTKYYRHWHKIKERSQEWIKQNPIKVKAQ